jgi:hypothetical protein
VRSELASRLTASCARSPSLQTPAARNPTTRANTMPSGGSRPGETAPKTGPRLPTARRVMQTWMTPAVRNVAAKTTTISHPTGRS